MDPLHRQGYEHRRAEYSGPIKKASTNMVVRIGLRNNRIDRIGSIARTSQKQNPTSITTTTPANPKIGGETQS